MKGILNLHNSTVNLVGPPRKKTYLHWKWVLLAVLFLIITFVPLPSTASQPTERVFRLEASRFAYSPAVLRVNSGDRVTIELVSQDVVHGFYLDGYDLLLSADPGQTKRLTFIANSKGTYRFRCTVTCGALHPFMNGKLVVGQNQLFWRFGSLSLLVVAAVLWRPGHEPV